MVKLLKTSIEGIENFISELVESYNEEICPQDSETKISFKSSQERKKLCITITKEAEYNKENLNERWHIPLTAILENTDLRKIFPENAFDNYDITFIYKEMVDLSKKLLDTY